MTFGPPTSEEVLAALLRLQGRGCFPTSPESVRVGELSAWADVWGLSLDVVYAFLCNAFPSTSTELLTEWEQALNALNDADRTIAERQERLSALRGFPVVQSLDEQNRVLSRLVATVMGKNTQLIISNEGTTFDAIAQRSLDLGDAYAPRNRRVIAWAARRGISTLNYGQLGRTISDAMVTDGVPALWSGDACFAGRSRLESTTTWSQLRDPARLRDYANLSRVDAADWNAIQARSLCGAANGPDSQVQIIGYGERRIWFACRLLTGSIADIETGVDFRYRLGRVFFIGDTVDRRPGQAGDTGLNGTAGLSRLWYTGAGGATYTLDLTIKFSVDAGDGTLRVQNGYPDTRSIVGYIELSDDVRSGETGGAVPFPLHTGEDFQDSLNSSVWVFLRASMSALAGNGASMDAWTGHPKATATTGFGGLTRTCVLGAMNMPATGTRDYVLDASVDWRDRLVHIEWTAAFGDRSARQPGGSDDGALQCDDTEPSTKIGYLGTGDVAYAIEIDTGLFRVMARASDGALIAQQEEGFHTEIYLSAILHVHASDELHVRGTTTARPSPAVPVDLDPVTPSHLNYLQDVGIAIQMHGRNVTNTLDEIPVDTMPLGLRVGGSPAVPHTYRRRKRNGVQLSSFTGEPTEDQAPQATCGRVRRVFAIPAHAISDEVVIDDSVDWRDRLITIMYQWDQPAGIPGDTSLCPGGTNDAAINDASFRVTFYGTTLSGTLVTDAAGIGWFVDPNSGALKMLNGTGDILTVVGVIEGTFALGPRSHKASYSTTNGTTV